MIRNLPIPQVLLAPFLLLLLASCGSSQYSGYEDGIYGDSGQRSTSTPTATESDQSQYATKEEDSGDDYYKYFFAEKSAMYGDMADQIFTDVENYTSADGYEEETYQDDTMAYTGSHAPWGNDPDEYTVNIYNNGFGGFYNPWRWGGMGMGWGNPYFAGGWGSPWGMWGDPFFMDPYWGGPFWGNRFGYGPWGNRFGFGPWGNRFGFGMGGMYGGFYGYSNWGWGWNSPFLGYNNRFNTRNVAYNSGRRNSYGDYSSARREANVSARNSRESSYSRSIRNIRNNSRSDNTATRRQATRDNSNIYSRSTRNSEPARVNRSSNQRSQNTYNRRTTRSNNSYNRSSTPSTRSSGTVRSSSTRSSGGATRSSGSTRGSGGRGGGR